MSPASDTIPRVKKPTKNSCSSRLSVPVPWRLRIDGPLSGDDNMRIDGEILESQKTPSVLPVLRFFRWTEPTVSYGRLQDSEEAEAWGKKLGARGFVRRPTGGGRVLHDKDLSFSLSWRRDHPAFPRCLKNIYEFIHAVVGKALNSRNVETSFFSESRPIVGRDSVCFHQSVENDLIREGEKILGGAIRVTGFGRLYQGNILGKFCDDELIPVLAEFFQNEFFQCPPEEAR